MIVYYDGTYVYAQCIGNQLYGYLHPTTPGQQLLPQISDHQCILGFRGAAEGWKEIEHYDDKLVETFVRDNPQTVIDFKPPEHPNDVVRHVGFLKYSLMDGCMFYDFVERKWQYLVGTTTYRVKDTAETLEHKLGELLYYAKKKSVVSKRFVTVSPENSLTITLAWYPTKYRYNAKNKLTAWYKLFHNYEVVDEDGIFDEHNNQKQLSDVFPSVQRKWFQLDVRVKIRSSFNFIRSWRKQQKAFNKDYICNGHCLYYSGCLWLDIMGFDKTAQRLKKKSKSWVWSRDTEGTLTKLQKDMCQPFTMHRVSPKLLWKNIENTCGVYTVCLVPGIHAVLIDANSKLIFDNQKEEPLELTRLNLDRCVGDKCHGFREAGQWIIK